jgi:VWFA-related protein
MNRLLAGLVVACLATPDWQAPTVTVDVGVEDSDGRPVTNLRQGDFEILVDATPRSIASFSAENRPLAVAMLVDVSASMSRVSLTDDDRYRRTLETFIRELRTGDRATLGRISGGSTKTGPLSGESAALFRDVNDVLTVPDSDRFGPSPLWDALDQAAEQVSRETGSRAAVLWTDGRSTGNHVGLADVIDRATAAGVSIHIIIEDSSSGGLTLRRGQKNEPSPCARVASLTVATGGTCRVNSLEGNGYFNEPPIPEVRRLLNALHQRYTLGFQADPDGQTHAVEVRVKRSGLRVRAPSRVLAK